MPHSFGGRKGTIPGLTACVNAGAALADLNVAASAAPWKQGTGYLHDDPVYEACRVAREEYRRRLDDAPEAP